MSKASDSIKWVFLKSVMLKLGFAREWVNLIINCTNLKLKLPNLNYPT